MGKSKKVPSVTSDSDGSTASSGTNKKKKRFSILRYTTTNNSNNKKKKKATFSNKSITEESSVKCRVGGSRPAPVDGLPRPGKKRLASILKCGGREQQFVAYSSMSDDDDDEQAGNSFLQGRILVGSAPRPVGFRPGRAGGVSIIIKRNVAGGAPEMSAMAKKRSKKRLMKKKSY